MFVREGEYNRKSSPLISLLNTKPGPYAPGVFRFHISFPVQYPQRPPNISFSTEIFHPLITPLTTYTYTTQDTGTDTISASDDERLPPGGLSLRHGFPQWFNHNTPANAGFELRQKSVSSDRPAVTNPPHILDVLYYMRSALMSEDFLNSIRLDAAANPNAWHAWQSYREKGPRSGSLSLQGGRTSLDDQDHSRQQPGGARKPGEWNWHGVWEDRVRKGVQFSVSENALFGKNLNQDDLVCYLCGQSFITLKRSDLILQNGQRTTKGRREIRQRLDIVRVSAARAHLLSMPSGSFLVNRNRSAFIYQQTYVPFLASTASHPITKQHYRSNNTIYRID